MSGSAILAIGVWKGTITNGAFTSTQRILTPTDDPAAQNIRTSLSPVTTTVTYSLPAFTLASNERLYIDVWRKQVSAINSQTASARQVNLIVNDAVSRIVHPVADDAAPVNSFQVANPTGGVYFNSPGGSSGTLFYRGSAAGSFRLQDFATDTGSGVTQVNYPAVTTAGWTHPVETVTTGPSYQSSTYSWTAGATASPGAQSIAAQDVASNSSDRHGHDHERHDGADCAVDRADLAARRTTRRPSVGLTLTDGTDSGSGRRSRVTDHPAGRDHARQRRLRHVPGDVGNRRLQPRHDGDERQVLSLPAARVRPRREPVDVERVGYGEGRPATAHPAVARLLRASRTPPRRARPSTTRAEGAAASPSRRAARPTPSRASRATSSRRRPRGPSPAPALRVSTRGRPPPRLPAPSASTPPTRRATAAPTRRSRRRRTRVHPRRPTTAPRSVPAGSRRARR